jgi:hypothetical protein
LGLSAACVLLGWGVASFSLDFVPPEGVARPWLKVLIAAGVAGILYFLFDVFYYYYRLGAVVRLDRDARNCLREEVRNVACSEVKVFASGGDEAKNIFLDLTDENFHPKRIVKIKVLLRTDASGQRDQNLRALVGKWLKDIDERTKNNNGGFEFQTEFVTYPHPVMLRGYLCGNRAAYISWYARDDAGAKFRSLPNLPLAVIKGSTGSGRAIIDQAVATFDFYFLNGGKL